MELSHVSLHSISSKRRGFDINYQTRTTRGNTSFRRGREIQMRVAYIMQMNYFMNGAVYE